MEVDYFSLSTTRILLYKGDELVSQGTGFFYLHQASNRQIVYLVTNYHVLTGSSPTQNKPPIGDKIAFQFHLSEVETGKTRTVSFPLFTKSGKPVWVTSSSYPEADLAVMPIVASLYQGCKINCVSAEWAAGDIKVRPTTTVALVGYPYDFYDEKNALPIWKTGSVASEPEVDFQGKPCFLIDVSAFRGMSGSPVFAISPDGVYEDKEGSIKMGKNLKTFLGIYASMVERRKEKYLEEIVHDVREGIVDYESLELGQVWKANLILETVKSINVENYQQVILKNLV